MAKHFSKPDMGTLLQAYRVMSWKTRLPESAFSVYFEHAALHLKAQEGTPIH